MNNKGQGEYAIVVGIVFVLGIILLFNVFYTIGAGYRGVLLTFGKPDALPVEQGLHVKIPFVQNIVKMSVQTQSYEVSKTSAASSDLQTVDTDVTVNYFINPDTVPNLYTNVGLDYQTKVIAPAIQEVIKATTAQYTAEQLITKRAEVKDKIDTALAERLKSWNINVQAVSITDFQFSPIFNEAIENKVTAEQNALAAKNKLDQVLYEAQQTIAKANGEAEAQKIQIESLKVQGGASYVQLQAINKWDGKLPLVNGGGSLPFINLAAGPTTTSTAVATNSTQ